MALTNRQKHLVESTTAILLAAQNSNIDGLDRLRDADDQLRMLFDAMGIPEFNKLGDVYEQILDSCVWADPEGATP